MNRKYSVITIGVALLALVLVYFIFFSVTGKETRQAHARWISAHTSGTVSAYSAIKVYFTRNIVTKEQTGIAVSDDIFTISPGVDGQAIWVQPNVLEFTPAQPFTNGKTYEVAVDLAEMIDSLHVDEYEFSFSIIRQNFSVEIEGIAPVDIQNAGLLKVYGNITLADKADAELVSKMLTAKVNDNTFPVQWNADQSGRHYQFVIDSIPRVTQSRTLTINYSGKPLHIDKKGTTTYQIPSKNKFILTRYKVQQHPEQQVKLFFSDPVERFQELTGLISFGKISDYQIDVAGNVVVVQPVERQKTEDKLHIHKGIKSTNDKALTYDTVIPVRFENLKPAVRAKSDDVVLPPASQGALFAFEAVNLRAVDVRIYRVFENNIIQFLQVNSLTDSRQMNRVGKPVFEQTVMLNQYANTDLGRWNTFYIDLNKVVEQAPGALYHVQIGFRHENAITECSQTTTNQKAVNATPRFWDDFKQYAYTSHYNWKARKDPCDESYYGFRRALKHNFMVSDIGVIAKKCQDNQLIVFTTQLSSTAILPGVNIEVLNYQKQTIASGQTDGSGRISFSKVNDPFFIKASDGKHATYVRLKNSEALSYSHFQTEGVTVEEGLKGYIYNERGVYRPGDTIHAGFMLHDLAGNFPEKAPVTFELYDARGRLDKRKVLTRNEADHYLAHFPTQTDDETGSWRLKVLAGSRVFTKSLSVETIKPNRLKINIDAPETVFTDKKSYFDIHAEWMHGAPVANLKYTVEGTAAKMKLKFDQWPAYQFSHQENQFSTSPEMYHQSRLNSQGSDEIPIYKPRSNSPPAKVSLSYFIKVFEPNGSFSIASARQTYMPYRSYVGLRLPEPTGRYNMYQTGKPVQIDLAAANMHGEKMKRTVRAKIKLYKVAWSWWWESNEAFGYRYRQYKELKQTHYVNIQNGKGVFDLNVDRKEWGRYLVEVTNMNNKQTASEFIYFDWPAIAGRSVRPEGVSQNMLRFATPKTKYETGENVSLSFPSTAGGKALVSIENGLEVIEDYWIDTQEGETSFSFKTTPSMSPNCYINVHYIQPYKRTANDLPLRLYGVAGIEVSDPEKHLQPVIEMNEEIETGKAFKVTVSERQGKPMNYTIAMVDEGLLGLTSFRTPDPYSHFFSHEALGVHTFDVFDRVIGAYSNTIERVIGIGGGAEGQVTPKRSDEQRFQPIVVVKGPFSLSKDKSMVHDIVLPPYIGEVRTMVIARNENAFGSARRSAKVKSPLMIMPTVPRKLVMNDRFTLPVKIFRDQAVGGNVKIEMEHNNNLRVESATRKIAFEGGQQEQTVYFECRAGKNPGQTTFNLHAMDGRNTAEKTIHTEIYNPTPTAYNVNYVRLDNQKSRTITVDPIGAPGTNKLTAEIATMPPFNMQKHMHYLLNYPHGCIEQTVSGVFGLLHLPDIMQLPENEQQQMTDKISAALSKLKRFQTVSGGFAFWAGSENVSQWGTNYAGHFMLAAQQADYKIERALYNKWLRYQKTMARKWVDNGPASQYIQAYRLYTLALANKAQRGAMNRLRGKDKLHIPVAWRLAAAYAVTGHKNVAEKLITSHINNTSPDAVPHTYGSELREQAMILQTLDYLGKDTEALNLIMEMSDQMIKDKWYSTQTRAWILYAISSYYSKRDVARKINIDYSINNGKKKTVKSSNHILHINFPLEFSLSQNIRFKNQSGGTTFLQLISQGKPLPGKHSASASQLNMEVQYLDFNNEAIDVSKIKQTTDFIAQIKVSHPGTRGSYENMALTFNAPSGWEIINTRFTEFNGTLSESHYTYRDFRDTRVMTYFDLDKNETKTFYLKLNATYPGRFYMAPVACKAMYDHKINARTRSRFVEVRGKQD